MSIASFRRSVLRRMSLVLIDLALLALATVLALLLRDNLDVDAGHFRGLSGYIVVSLAIAAPILVAFGLDRSVWRFSALSDYLRVVFAVLAIVAGAVVISFVINRMEGVARALPVLQFLLASILLVSARVVMRLRHAGRRASAPPVTLAPLAPQESVLVLGLNSIAELYIRSVTEFASERIRICGLIGRSENQRGRTLQTYEVLGAPEQISSIIDTLSVHGVVVDRIVIAVALSSLSEEARGALFALERTSAIRLDFFAERVWSPDSSGTDYTSGGSRPAQAKDIKLQFSVDGGAVHGSGRRLFWFTKRLIDIVGAAVLLIILAPVFAILTVCVLVDIGYPAVFWQQRPGCGGRPFRLRKFRTMADAHDAQGRRIPDAMRLSAFGHFMRRTRLDELPQLINILVGDMSFVGPRPLLPVDQSDDAVARLLVRPGLTGWAQVMGGRIITAADKAALDVWYVCNASFSLDLKIVARTVPMILFGERPNMPAIQRAWSDLRRSGVCTRVTNDAPPLADAAGM